MSGLGSGIVFFSKYLFRTILFLSHRRLETKTNKKLADVYQPLLQGGIDRNESEREEKLKETPNGLHRIFRKGFLLTRLTMPNRCPCSSDVCASLATHKRAVFLVIDMLRFNFIEVQPPDFATL